MCADVVSAEEGVRKGVSAGRVVHLSEGERVARGKAARGEVPRSVHAGWEPSLDRPSPVKLLEEQAQSRVPELVPIRYGRMLVSPFTFYRGAAFLMASDLSVYRGRGCWCSCVVMHICRTSVVSRRRIGGWCSASTISTRRIRGRLSGM